MSGSVELIILVVLIVLGNLLFVKSFSLGQKVFKYEVDAISNGFLSPRFFKQEGPWTLGPSPEND